MTFENQSVIQNSENNNNESNKNHKEREKSIEREQWLQQFAEQVTTAPENINGEQIHQLITCIELCKFNSTREKHYEIDTLIRSLMTSTPDSPTGNQLFRDAAIMYADQYRRRAERVQFE
ncbi:MAG: hypothetical protein M3Q73_00800 [bacterium]|nr:hypothetical protein [bacterium]